MVAVGVVVHLFLRHWVDIVEASGESLPDYGVDVNIGGVFGRRCPPWRRFIGMLPAWSLSSRWKHFSSSSEERRRRLRCRFLLEGVALEVMGLICLWCFGFAGVGRLEDWSENKLEA
jgi:hypothetical protein